MSFWWLSSPYTEALWVARAVTAPKAWPSVPPGCGSPQRRWSSPLLLPSSTCNHKAEGNQVSCRFGPARKAADLWKQVNSPKLKCLYKMNIYLLPRISGLTLPIIRWDIHYQLRCNKNIPKDCYECCLPSHHSLILLIWTKTHSVEILFQTSPYPGLSDRISYNYHQRLNHSPSLSFLSRNLKSHPPGRGHSITKVIIN